MTTRKFVGGAIVASPFVFLFSFIAHDSLIAAVCIFGGVAAVITFVGVGVFLLLGD